MAAVDCLHEEELCEEEFGVRGINIVKVYTAKSDAEPHKYTLNQFTEKDLANFAVKFMESFVEYVSFSNYDDFIKRDQHKVIYFYFHFKFFIIFDIF